MNRGEATTKILRSVLPTHQKLILLSYIEHQTSSDAVEDGISFPGVETIAGDISASARTVTRHRAALIEAGLLEVAREVGGGLLFCKVNLAGLDARPKKQDTESATGDGESSRGDTESGVTESQGDRESSRGDSLSSRGDTESVGGDTESPEPSVENPPQRTLRREPSGPAPAEPDPQPSTDAPPAPSEASTVPLWEQLELPSPGKGCPVKLLSRDVLDVWAYWQRVHVESGRGKARVIGKDAVKAIHGALRWEPTTADECPEGWTVKRLLCTVIAYAYRAPEGSPGVDWWRKPNRHGSDLNPETLLRLGRDPKLPRNARWAVAWSTSLRVLPGGKSSTPEPARHQHTAERLWEAWANPMLGRERCEAIAIPAERWWDFVGVVREAGHPRDITSMHAIDRKQARKVFIERAIHWLESQGPEVTCG